MPRGTFLDCSCHDSCLYGEPLLTHASTGDPPTLAGSFGSVFCGVTAFFLFLVVCKLLFVPSKTGVSQTVSRVQWKSYNQILLAFKVRFPRDSQSLCHIPRLGSMMWCPELSQQRENFAIIILQFVGHPPGGYGI